MTWAVTGREAIDLAHKANPDLIILDLRLPNMRGFDVGSELRKDLRQPILMLAVRDEEVDKVLRLEMGADDYMTKPYSLRELIARVRALLRRSYGELAAAAPPPRLPDPWGPPFSCETVYAYGPATSSARCPSYYQLNYGANQPPTQNGHGPLEQRQS